VKKAIPGTTAFNINYPADMSATSPDKGAEAVISYFGSKAKQCPSQKYIIVGYSQGCVVQRRAMVKLDSGVLNRIVAAVTFGDPGKNWQGKRYQFFWFEISSRWIPV
jgi:cutinase